MAPVELVAFHPTQNLLGCSLQLPGIPIDTCSRKRVVQHKQILVGNDSELKKCHSTNKWDYVIDHSPLSTPPATPTFDTISC